MREKFLYLPEEKQDAENSSSISEKEPEKSRYPCPCCGYLTFPVPKEQAIAYICPVCFWENDVFTPGEDEHSDENHGMTLRQARENFRMFGACSEDMWIYVRSPKPEEYPKNGEKQGEKP